MKNALNGIIHEKRLEMELLSMENALKWDYYSCKTP